MPGISVSKIPIPFKRAGISWSSYWNPQSYVVENADSDALIVTYATQPNPDEMIAANFAVSGNTISSITADATGLIFTFALATPVYYSDTPTLTANEQVYNITNNVLIAPLTLTARSTGAGVSTLVMTSSADIIVTLSGAARFYTNSAGTTGESATWNLATGANRTTYIKCPSGTAEMSFADASKVTSFLQWTGDANSPNLSGDVSRFINTTTITISGTNALSGDIARIVALQKIQLFSSNTISGDITNHPNLTNIELTGSTSIYGDIATLTAPTKIRAVTAGNLYGDITLLTSLTYLDIAGTGVITGDISNLIDIDTLKLSDADPLSTVYGNVEGLVKLKYLYIISTGTVTGSIAGLTLLQYCNMQGNSTITAPNVTNLTGLCYLYLSNITILTEANVNQILADFWANRDAAKARAERVIDLRASQWSSPPTGQGLTDKAALEAYHSPTPPGTAALWTVNTRTAGDVFDNGKLILSFDDGHRSCYEDIYPLLGDQSVAATFYLIPSLLDVRPKMLWTEVQTMYANSMDMQCHTNDVVDMRTLSAAQTTATLQAVNDAFTAHSMDVPVHLAYPSGYYNASVKSYVSALRSTARTVGNIADSVPIFKDYDKYALPSVAIESLDAADIAAFKKILDAALAVKGAVITYAHWINDGEEEGGITSAQLNEIIDYAQTIGIDIITMSGLYALMDA